MKITFLHPTVNMSGGIRVIALYAQELAARGHEVCHVSVAPQKPSMTRRVKALIKGQPLAASTSSVPASHIDDTDVPHHVAPGPTLGADDVPDGDIVVATWWETAEWAMALPASKGVKVHLLQDYEMFPHLPHDRVAQVFEAPMHRIAVSEYIRTEFKEKHGVIGIDLVPNAVDVAQFTSPPRRKNDSLVAGIVYTDRPRKNLALAIEVLNQATQALPSLKTVGFGTQEPAAHLPLPKGMAYHRSPAQSDIPGLYASADVWLFTSTHEGFGLPLLEAMACRTPVLATPAGAAPDLITGRNGVVLPADVSAFVAELQRFAQMPDATWQTYAQAAFETAQSYSWGDAVDLLEGALGRICQKATRV